MDDWDRYKRYQYCSLYAADLLRMAADTPPTTATPADPARFQATAQVFFSECQLFFDTPPTVALSEVKERLSDVAELLEGYEAAAHAVNGPCGGPEGGPQSPG